MKYAYAVIISLLLMLTVAGIWYHHIGDAMLGLGLAGMWCCRYYERYVQKPHKTDDAL
jgi:hypothetical protein